MEVINMDSNVRPASLERIVNSELAKKFIDEQVEEEENAQEIIDKLRMIGDNGYGKYMLDKELEARVYTTPSPLASKE